MFKRRRVPSRYTLEQRLRFAAIALLDFGPDEDGYGGIEELEDLVSLAHDHWQLVRVGPYDRR